VTKAEAQKQIVKACRAAMPAAVGILWETVLHAPTAARDGVLEMLASAMPDEGDRAIALLTWCGHSDGHCPVCRMLVGGLVFSLGEPVGATVRAADRSPKALDGACFFLGTQLRLSAARAAGLGSERLAELQAKAAALPEAFKERLRSRWAAKGGEALTI
jgi:hypothetical protein